MKFPAWYYQTTPDPSYPGIDEPIRELTYLLRNNGWNTTSSCGPEYKGLIIIDLYDEQMGWMSEYGGPVYCLRRFLLHHGYHSFEIEQRDTIANGKVDKRILILSGGKREVE